MPLDVYLYGMTVLSTIQRMATVLPDADGYGEIAETFVCPGGEAMNAAMLLAGPRTAHRAARRPTLGNRDPRRAHALRRALRDQM